ncbi:polyhomeotic-like protein 3-like [Arapaima gigas]
MTTAGKVTQNYSLLLPPSSPSHVFLTYLFFLHIFILSPTATSFILCPLCPFCQIPLPPLPVVAQRGVSTKHSTSKTAVSTISHNALLLGNSMPTSQAQVYLRAKMVQTLALRTPQSLPLKSAPTPNALALPHVSVFAQQPEGPSKAGKTDERPGGRSHDSPVNCLQSAHQLPIPPAPTLYSSIQRHGLVKHMLQYKSIHKGVPNQLIIPRPVRVHRPKVSLQATAQKTPPTLQVCLTSEEPVTSPSSTMTTTLLAQSQTSPVTVSSAAHSLCSMAEPSQTECSLNSPMQKLHSSTDMSPAVAVTSSTASAQSQLPTLKPAPLTQLQGCAQISSHSSAKKPPPLVPHLSQESSPSKPIHTPPTPQVSQVTVKTTSTAPPPSPPPVSASSEPVPGSSSTLKALQLLRALVQESEMLPRKRMLELKDQKEEIHPAPKVKAPSTILSSPPNSAIDLLDTQESQEGHVSVEMAAVEERHPEPPARTGSPTAPSPLAPLGADGSCEDASTLLASCAGSASSPSPPPSWPPAASHLPHVTPEDIMEPPRDLPISDNPRPPLQHSLVWCRSQSPTASHPEGPGRQSPHAIFKPQILTHLVEGFVIQEGLEPFPVSRSSLMVEHQSKEGLSNGTANTVIDLDQSEISDNNDMTAEATDTLEEEALCEFCGKRGHAHTFLRSQRFCSVQCTRGFNMAYSKRVTGMKANKISRWTQRAEERRSRPPSTAETSQPDRLLRQRGSARYSSTSNQSNDGQQFLKEDEVDEPSVPMKTRLRRQAEQNLQVRERVKPTSDWTPGSPLSPPPNPNLWTVEHVWAFIHAMPGCRDIAEEFRSQEIDGQALLLLTEDHLVGAMKLKLGPALKIHARISALKAP